MTHYHNLPGNYLVFGKDASGIQDGLLNLTSAHWDYIDRFAPQLMALGPLLTLDGQEHTDSIHILTSPTFHAAHRFASEEPYCQAHFDSNITVTPFWNFLGQTMWVRAPPIQPKKAHFLK